MLASCTMPTVEPALKTGGRVYVQVPAFLLQTLSHGEFKIYSVLLAHLNPGANGNVCWPSMTTIAREAGLTSPDQARRYIHALAERGLLQIERRGDCSNVYSLRYLVVEGCVVDAGALAPADQVHPGKQRQDEHHDAPEEIVQDGSHAPVVSSTQMEAATTLSAGRASSEQRFSPPLSRFCREGAVYPPGRTRTSAGRGLQKCRPNEKHEAEERSEKKTTTAPATQHTLAHGDGVASGRSFSEGQHAADNLSELYTPLVRLGMRAATAHQLVQHVDHDLLCDTFEEACRRDDVQNRPGWIIQVAAERQKARYTPGGNRIEACPRSMQFLPNLPAKDTARAAGSPKYLPNGAHRTEPDTAPPGADAMDECGDAGKVEAEGSQHASRDENHVETVLLCQFTSPLSSPPVLHDQNERVCRGKQAVPVELSGAQPGAEAGTDGNQASRLALLLLIRHEKPQLRLPALAPAIRQAAEHALDAVVKQAREHLSTGAAVSPLETRALAFSRHMAGAIAA